MNAGDNSKVDTHTVTVSVYLDLYPQVKLDLPAFTITVTKCIVTSVSVVQSSDGGALVAQSYTMSDTAVLGYQLKVQLTPACGYNGTAWTVSATGGPLPANFQDISSLGLYNVGPTYGTSEAGVYNI